MLARVNERFDKSSIERVPLVLVSSFSTSWILLCPNVGATEAAVAA
jgi:hypothetical protein